MFWSRHHAADPLLNRAAAPYLATLPMSDEKTIGVYNARAEEYAAVTAGDGPDDTLRAFMQILPAHGRVLDLGCGPGITAGYMAAAGFEVEAWDASEQMLALAAQRPGVTTRHAVFADLEARDTYDGVWANFSLLHAPVADLPGHLAAIKRALRPGGAFHIALKEGVGEKRDEIGRKYSYYTVESLSAHLREAGLTPGPFRKGVDKGLDGKMAPWISTTAHA